MVRKKKTDTTHIRVGSMDKKIFINWAKKRKFKSAERAFKTILRRAGVKK